MSASSKKKQRAQENSAKLTEKQKTERKEANKLRAYTAAFIAVVAVMIVIFVVVVVNQTITNSGIRQKNTIALTVGAHEINSVELNYFYMDQINNFYSNYGSYASLFGLDVSSPLNEQVTDEDAGTTWADDFLESAKSTAKSVYAMIDAADAAGYTLSEDDESTIETYSTNIDSYASVYGYSDTDDYIAALYGSGSTKESYLDYYRKNLLASSYQTYYEESLTFTDEEIETQYAEDPTDYTSYSYHQYYLAVSKFQTGGTTDEDGNTTYTDEETAAAQEAALEAAQSLTGSDIESVEDFDAAIAALSINADSDSAASSAYDDVLGSSVSSNYSDWVTDSSRVAGDKTYIESTSTSTADDGTETTTVSGYYVVFFEGSNDNTFPLVNVRHILVSFEGGTTDDDGNTTYSDEEKAAAKEEAEAILEEWKSGDAAEDSFAALATERTDDTGSQDNGGLYENIYPGQMVTAFNDWCFDESRQPGDTDIVETTYGYHVMYFSSESDLTYRNYLITEDLREDAVSAWETEVEDAVTVTDGDTQYIKMDLVISSST